MKSKDRGFTVFVVIIIVSVFVSIGLSVLSTAVNLHKTSIEKIQFIGRNQMLKSSLVYPKLMIEDYFKTAFYKVVNVIKIKYQAYSDEEILTQIENIQKDYKRLIKDEIYFINQMSIYIDISKIKVEDCVFKVIDFKAEPENIKITVMSNFDSRDYVNSYVGVFKIKLENNLTAEEIGYIMSGDYDTLWNLHKEDLVGEKFYGSY